MRRRRFIALTVIVLLFISAYFLIKPAFSYLSGYLSKSTQVNANILVVEGWLPSYGLEMANDEYQKKGYDYVITTGLEYSSDYYILYRNGYLIFYPGNKIESALKDFHHTIEVNAYSELGGTHQAHFNLFMNNLLIADFNVAKRKQIYSATWDGTFKDNDSIMVEFTNDAFGDFGEVNLFVKEIIIDHKIRIPFQNNSVYNIGSLDGKRRIINNFNSYAELARNRLITMGISSSRIIATPGNRARINRTLTSALAFRDWLKTTNIDIRGINIITIGTHARRTWMTYNKILDEKYSIGIISLPDYRYRTSIRMLKTIRETLGIIYYWFILIPY
jgi:hypothetical protein